VNAPFPWFGGKRKVARDVWAAFGDVPNYVEPFFGSGAVLLQRPASHTGRVETINDLDGFVANFWRAIQHDSEAVAAYSDWPVSEIDLTARHIWLVNERAALTDRLEADTGYFDAKIAGWWVWGVCAWIGSGWCSGTGPWQIVDGTLQIGDAGRGINRQMPHLGNAGRGINRQMPHLGDAGQGGVNAWFAALSERLRAVRICSGDWSRVVTPSVTDRHGVTGVFLDPPYSAEDYTDGLYAMDSRDAAHDVRDWAIANGDNPLLRIALCGYDDVQMPDSWTPVRWKSHGGYGAGRGNRADLNAHRETIWFSPHCITHKTPSLFDMEALA
jgi:DNA adenine methylase